MLGRIGGKAWLGVVEVAEACVGSWPEYTGTGGRHRKDWSGVQPKYRAYCGGSKEREPEQAGSDHGSAVMSERRLPEQGGRRSDDVLFLFFSFFFLYP